MAVEHIRPGRVGAGMHCVQRVVRSTSWNRGSVVHGTCMTMKFTAVHLDPGMQLQRLRDTHKSDVGEEEMKTTL